jgi:hypothetical protein
MRRTERRGPHQGKPFLAVALVAAAGAAIALPLVLAVRATGDAPRSEATTPARAATDAELQRLRAEVQSLKLAARAPSKDTAERGDGESGDDEDSAESTSPAPEQLLTRDEELREEETMWRERLARFDAEPVNPAWRAEVEGRLHPVLQPIAAELSGRITGLDCRSSRCKATIHWDEGKVPTVEDARRLILGSIPAARGCARHVRLSDPDSGDATTLLLECAHRGTG